MRILGWLALAAGAAVTSVILHGATGGDPDGLRFILWALSPHVAFALLQGRMSRPWASAVASLGALAASAFGAVAFYDGFYVHLDALNGLLFIFVPLWQWFGFGLVAVLAGALERPRGSREASAS